MLTVAVGEHRRPGMALVGTMGCWVIWLALAPGFQWVSSTLGAPTSPIPACPGSLQGQPFIFPWDQRVSYFSLTKITEESPLPLESCI